MQRIAAVVTAFLLFICLQAQSSEGEVVSPTVDTQPQLSAFDRHFVWGADLGSSIDLTGQAMTAIDLDANFGYKGDFLRFAGVGAGIKMMVSNSSRSFPIYGMIRSSFTRNPRFLFGEIKAGIAVNNFYTNNYQRDFYGSIGIGFTLASGRTFSSHMLLSYEFMPVKADKVPEDTTPLTDLHFASIRIGVSF